MPLAPDLFRTSRGFRAGNMHRALRFGVLVPLCCLGGEALFETDFERPTDPAASALVKHERVQHLPEGGRDGTGGIRVAYVGSERGSERVVKQFELARAVPEATLVFDVLFEEEFQFVRGGKLLGLGPADPAVGGEKVSPGTWSARLMFGSEGGLKTYNYHQRIDKKYGEGRTALDFAFAKSRWYRVAVHVRLNQPPHAANGFCHVYIDGKRIIEDDALQFRAGGGDHTLIRRFLFHTFHGGSNRSYAPVDPSGGLATVHARFDNLAVYPGRVVARPSSP